MSAHPVCLLCHVVLVHLSIVWPEIQDVSSKILIVFLISCLMLTKYFDSHARNVVFSMSISLMYSCSMALCCKITGTMLHLAFIAIPFIIALSS